MYTVYIYTSSKIPKTAVGFAVLRMQMAKRSPVHLLTQMIHGAGIFTYIWVIYGVR